MTPEVKNLSPLTQMRA
ncbi:hypothetical protein [Helicobacter pylori]